MTPAVMIYLSLDDERWRAQGDVGPLVERAAQAALARQGVGLGGAVELSLALADDAVVHELNRLWRGIDKPTNVLAFPGDPAAAPAIGLNSPPRQLGDVIVAYETVVAEARHQAKPVGAHLSHLIVHGVLHLLGFDHESDAEAAIMEAEEIAILAGLGVPDPYGDAAASSGPTAGARVA